MFATKAEAILALKDFISTYNIKCKSLTIHKYTKVKDQGFSVLEFKCDATSTGKYEQFTVHKDEHGIYGEW